MLLRFDGRVVAALLALRFVLELCLLGGMGLLGASLVDSTAAGWALGLLLVAATALLWGLLLSPRRRIDLPLGVRVAGELALFALAAVGLARPWGIGWGWALVITELVVLGWLWAAGHAPGSQPLRT